MLHNFFTLVTDGGANISWVCLPLKFLKLVKYLRVRPEPTKVQCHPDTQQFDTQHASEREGLICDTQHE